MARLRADRIAPGLVCIHSVSLSSETGATQYRQLVCTHVTAPADPAHRSSSGVRSMVRAFIRDREPAVASAALAMHAELLGAATSQHAAAAGAADSTRLEHQRRCPVGRERTGSGWLVRRSCTAGTGRQAAREGDAADQPAGAHRCHGAEQHARDQGRTRGSSHRAPGHPMIAGLSGSLLSHEGVAGHARPAATDPEVAVPRRRLHAWIAAVLRTMGPASSARAVCDRVAVPLFSELGFRTILTRTDTGGVLRGVLHAGGLQAAVVLVTGWGREPGAAWRDAVRLGIGKGVRWCLCVNGPVVRVFDARRTYSRRFVQFDLEATIRHPDTFTLFWHLLHADAFSTATPRTTRPCGPDFRGAPCRSPCLTATWRARCARAPRFGVRACTWPPHPPARRGSVRRVAHGLVPHPVPAVRRGARAGARVASDIRAQLHDRVAEAPDRTRSPAQRGLGGASSDLTPGAQRLPRRNPPRRAVQRALVLSG